MSDLKRKGNITKTINTSVTEIATTPYLDHFIRRSVRPTGFYPVRSSRKTNKTMIELKGNEYYDGNIKYQRVSRVISNYKSSDFNEVKDIMAVRVSGSRKKEIEKISKEKGISTQSAQMTLPKYERGITPEQVLSEWDKKRDDANDRGNEIHNDIEESLKVGYPVSENFKSQVEKVFDLLMGYYKIIPEEKSWSNEYLICGTKDVRAQRTRSKKSIIDLYDHKTNPIFFDSSVEKKGKVVQTNKMMKYPLNHLECCNYNHYCLQLSTYAYLEMLKGVKIGKLGIIHIFKDEEPYIIRMPFMRYEVQVMLKHYNQTLNEVISS